jgi:pyruvate dehydrogenase (quinone)
MSTNVAEHLVDLTLASGIRQVYGMVGDSADPVIDAIRRAADELTLVPIRNEEAGAFARLVFAGDTAEVAETIKSNVRNIPQATR